MISVIQYEYHDNKVYTYHIYSMSIIAVKPLISVSYSMHVWDIFTLEVDAMWK